MITRYSHLSLSELILRRDDLFVELGAQYARYAARQILPTTTPEQLEREGERYFADQAIYEQMSDAIQLRFIAGESAA
jgi:hypothetical protein